MFDFLYYIIIRLEKKEFRENRLNIVKKKAIPTEKEGIFVNTDFFTPITFSINQKRKKRALKLY
jgi:hypothetical protein